MSVINGFFRDDGMVILQKFAPPTHEISSSFCSTNAAWMNRGLVVLFIFLLAMSLFTGCVTGRWVQEGKTDEDIQRDLTDCKDLITEEEGVEPLPEQFTSTRYWEREPPLRPSEETIMAKAMRQCMESKGYKFFRK